MDIREAVTTYNPQTDTLTITLPPSRAGFADSADGRFLFLFYDERDSPTPSGFEVHWFSEVWDNPEVLPDPGFRFRNSEAGSGHLSWRELLCWAHRRFVLPEVNATA